MHTLPEPLTAYSPSTPALLNSIFVVVPLRTVVVPTVIDDAAAMGEAHVPSPRQNVVDEAAVPPLKSLTAKLRKPRYPVPDAGVAQNKLGL